MNETLFTATDAYGEEITVKLTEDAGKPLVEITTGQTGVPFNASIGQAFDIFCALQKVFGTFHPTRS